MSNNLDCTRTMRINACSGTRYNVVRASLRERASLNQQKALAGSIRLLDNPDIDVDVKTDISQNQVLSWDADQERFVNATIGTIAPGAGTVPRTREIFIKSTAVDNSKDGDSTADAVLDFEAGIGLMSNFANAFESVQFWISGDIEFNTGGENGTLREGSVTGNVRRGVSIRGLSAAKNYNALNSTDPPRSETSNMEPGTTLAKAPPTNNFSANATLTDAGNGLNAWNSVATIADTINFLRDEANHTYPIRTDQTTIDGITAGQRIFLATSKTNPGLTQTFTEMTLPCSITCTNLTGNGLPTNPDKPGFSMTGNVQFTEVHFKLLNDVVTPIHINGQFQVLYSWFSNITGSGTGATLELSATGFGDDPNYTAEIDPLNVTTASLKNVRIYSSVFQDLNIKVDSSCEFKDCVFTRCKFMNTNGTVFTSCVFYDSRSSLIGDPTDTKHLNNSLSIEKSYLMYGAAGSFITCDNKSSIELRTIISRPQTINAGIQTVPIITLNGGSYGSVTNIHIPTSSGVNTTLGGNELGAILIAANGSKVRTDNLKIIGGASTCSFISSHSSSDIIIGDIDNTCTNAGPILTSHDSTVHLLDFNAVLPITFANTTTTSGVFKCVGSNVLVSPSFQLNMNASSTTVNLFYLDNSTLRNSKSTVADSFFNITNAVTKQSFHMISSNVTILGGANAGNAGAQTLIQGKAIVDNHSTLNIIGWEDGTWDPAYVDNVNWATNNAGGDVVLTVNNNSKVNLSAVNLDVYGASSGYVARIADVNRDSQLTIYRSKIDVLGFTGNSGLVINNNSEVHMTDSIVRVRANNSKPGINVTNNSKFGMVNTVPGTARTLQIDAATNVASVDYNSALSLLSMGVVTATVAKGFIVTNGSNVNVSGTNGNVINIDIATTTGTTDAAFELSSLADLILRHTSISVNPSGGRALIADGLCNAFMEAVTAGANLSGEGVQIDHLTKLHTKGTNTVPTTYLIGTTAAITRTSLESSPFIYPPATVISDGSGAVWIAARGCIITYVA